MQPDHVIGRPLGGGTWDIHTEYGGGVDITIGPGSVAAHGSVAAFEEAHRRAARAGRELAFVAFACGTEGDPQDLRSQEGALAGAGVRLATSNAHAVRLAASLVTPRER